MNARNNSEATFMAQIVRLATNLGYRHYHPRYSLGSDRGWPDIVICRAPRYKGDTGRIIFAELKTAKGVLSDAQKEWLDLLAACGQEVHLWRPADMPEIIKVLQGEKA